VAAVAFYVGFGVLTGLTMKNNNFWDDTAYSGRSSPTFRRKSQPLSSDLITKLRKQQGFACFRLLPDSINYSAVQNILPSSLMSKNVKIGE
jgi:hypothetical protein